MQQLNIKDLGKIKTNGYKITFILPELSETQNKYFKKYMSKIYATLFAEDQENGFDAEKQLLKVKINGENKNLVLARNVKERNELLKYSFDIVRSLNRLADEGSKMEILKLMPSGEIINANLIPLCKIKEMSASDSFKFYSDVLETLNNEGEFEFIANLDKDGTTNIYYTKDFLNRAFCKGYTLITQDIRATRAIRLLNAEILKNYDYSFLVNDNVIFLNELGENRENNLSIPVSPRNSKKSKKQPETKKEITLEDFYSVNTKNGMSVFALKEYLNRQEVNFAKIVLKFGKKALIDCIDKLEVSCVDLGDKKYLAIMCANRDLPALKERATVLYSMLRESRYYRYDKNMFYYLDANNRVTPLNQSYLCHTNLSKEYRDMLSVALQQGLQSCKGYEIDSKINTDGTDFYLKVAEYECVSAQSYENLMQRKRAALKSAAKTFDKRIKLLQNDGAPMSLEELKQMNLTTDAKKAPIK